MKTVTKVLTGMVVVASLAATSALAANGDSSNQQFQRRSGRNSEQRAAIQQSVEEGNYSKWHELITKDGRQPKIAEVINAENFGKLKEMHEARKNGDMDSVKKIAEELGIKPFHRNGKHHRRKKGHRMSQEVRTALDAAIESGDYEAFKSVHEKNGMKGRILEKITAENFAKFGEMHKAIRSGDREAARKIAEELGFNRFGGRRGMERCDHEKGDPVEFGRSRRERGEGRQEGQQKL